MNKNDLLDIIAADAQLSQAQADSALKSTLGTISSALRAGETVTLNGFGTFLVRRRASRRARDLRTGQAIDVEYAIVPSFRPSNRLIEALKPDVAPIRRMHRPVR